MKGNSKWIIFSAIGSLVSLGIGIISDIWASKAAREIDEEEYQKDFEKRVGLYLEEHKYVKELDNPIVFRKHGEQ